MVSNMLSDRIENFILEQMRKQSTSVIVLKRKKIAEMLDCAPSQVTYVINTRFGTNHRFRVESRRGTGGFIRISVLQEMEERKGIPEKTDFQGDSAVESFWESYFYMLISTESITMREYLMLRELVEVMMNHCPAERRKAVAEDAIKRIGRIIREGK